MGKTSLVTALRDDDNRIYAIVDEDGQTIPHGATETPAILLTADHQVSAADNKGILTNATATARGVMVPPGLPKGFAVSVAQMAAGAVTIVGGAGVTITNKSSFTKTGGAGSMLTITNTGEANKYIMTGDGAA